MRIDHHQRELVCKVVYCGPGMSGKTTNLHYIHTQAPPKAVGKMVSIDTESERTLHFDLLPLDLGSVHGYKCRFEFYTVPGQSYYAATRRLVMDGADGVVFVVDSRLDSMEENIESMNDLNDNIRHHELPDDMPIVIQYNKQDLEGALPADSLNPLLNHLGHPHFIASAKDGKGVIETMKKVTTMVIDRIQRYESLADIEDNAPNTHTTTGSIRKRPSGAEPQTISKHEIEEESPAAPAPETWLLCCYNCECMLEVPHARVGDQFQCGQCQAPLVVVNPDQGTTKAPETVSGVVAPPRTPTGNVALSPNAGSTAISPASGNVALSPASGTGALPSPSGGSAIQPPPTDDTGYGMQSLPDPSKAALNPLPATTSDLPTPASGNQIIAEGFPLDSYTVISQLDSSLLGNRFRVQDNHSGTIYRALVLSPGLLRQPGYLEGLDSYVQMAASISHAGINKVHALRCAHVHNVILSHDAPDFQPLSAVLARRQTLPPPQAMGVVRQLIEALEVASHSGIVHGWIRPEVILVDSNGTVKLDDLGAPKLHSYLLHESIGASAATEHYLAPENLLNDSPSDVRTDMFMIGAVLFKAISGRGLVAGYSAHEALHKLNAAGVKTLRDVQPDISRELNRVVAKMTALDRRERFQNHRELLANLERFGGGAAGGAMRLTRSIPAGTGSNKRARNAGSVRNAAPAGKTTGHHQRTQTGSTIPPVTSSHRRTTTGHHQRQPRHTRHTAGLHDDLRKPVPKKKKSGGAGLAIFILLLLAASAAGAIYYFYQQNRSSGTTFPAAGGSTAGQNQNNTSETPTETGTGKDETTTTNGSSSNSVSLLPPPPENNTTTTETDPNGLIQAAEKAMAAFVVAPADSDKQEHARTAIVALRTDHKPEFSRLWAKFRETIPAISSNGDSSDESKIQGLVDQRRFGAALKRIEGLADEAQRSAWVETVDRARKARRAELNKAAWAAPDMASARQALAEPLITWEVDADRDWAESVLAAIDQKFKTAAEEEAKRNATTAQVTMTKPKEETTPDGLPLELVKANIALDEALVKNQIQQAESIVKKLAAHSESEAMTTKIALWSRRAQVLAAAMAERKMRIRVSTPINRQEQWDVTAVTPEHLKIQKPSGGGMNLPWSDIARSEYPQLFIPMASADTSKPVEMATACISCLLAGDPGKGSLFMRKARTAKYEKARDLDVLVRLQNGTRYLELLAVAEQAQTAHDIDGLDQAITALQKYASTSGHDDPAVAKYQGALENLKQGKSATGKRFADDLSFKNPSDLDAFDKRSGSWAISSGAVSNDGGRGSLSRSDCGNARSASFRWSTSAKSGTVAMDFRGVRCLVDFNKETVQVDSRNGTVPPKALTVLPHTPYECYFSWDGTAMSVQVNQQENMSVRPGPLTTATSFRVDDGTRISLDHFQIKRQGDGIASGNTDRTKLQEQLRDVLGLDPYGSAYKDPDSPAIVLPHAENGPSGVGVRLTESIEGASFAIAGTAAGAQLLICIGSVENKNHAVGRFKHLNLPAPGGAPARVLCKWNGQKYTVSYTIDGAEPIFLEADFPEDARHLIIGATGGARLSTPPNLIRK